MKNVNLGMLVTLAMIVGFTSQSHAAVYVTQQQVGYVVNAADAFNESVQDVQVNTNTKWVAYNFWKDSVDLQRCMQQFPSQGQLSSQCQAYFNIVRGGWNVLQYVSTGDVENYAQVNQNYITLSQVMQQFLN